MDSDPLTAETQPLPPLRVLVVDDEKNIRAMLAVCLESEGCTVIGVDSPSAALSAVSRQPFDLAFLDLRLGDRDGLDLLPDLLARAPGLAVVVITAYATVDTAVEAVRRGAWEYLPKPFTPAQIRHVTARVAEHRMLRGRLRGLEELIHQAVPEADLETTSPAMQAAIDVVSRAAVADAPVLLRGESGTGKGVLARVIHAQSPRAAGPFVVVNCPTLSEELLASELFGHAKGAFTGAVRDQPGRVEAAHGGTLFLDEIGELSPGLQAKLLRFLQEKQFERVGENLTRHADVRIVAATNRDLDSDVRDGRFREDLLYRINVVEVTVPPLRERTGDILPLARCFLEFFGRTTRRPGVHLSAAVEAALAAYSWPGNVRELRNTIERAVILSQGPELAVSSLPERIAGPVAPGPTLGGDFTIETIEREHILRVLARVDTQEEAARILGIDVSTLWRKRKRGG